jgi:hypothetical protein
MNWAGISGVFTIATVKFMFSTVGGPTFGLAYYETFLAAFAGGSVSAAVFYFASDKFMEYSHNKKVAKEKELLAKGVLVPHKKKFTKTNRLIIGMKMKLGIYGICFWVPFFFSVPIGSMIVAKFYGKLNQTYPLIVIGMAINSAIITFITYAILG